AKAANDDKKMIPSVRPQPKCMAAIVTAMGLRAASCRSRLCGLAVIVSMLPLLNGCAWLDERQRQIALRPTPGRPADADSPARFRPGDERILLPAASAPAERLALWWLPQA